jgi:predicted ester cyclase
VAVRSSENGEFVRQHYEKLRAGDWQAAAEDYADDAANFGRPVRREGYLRMLEDTVNGGRLVGVEPTGKHFEVQHIHWHKVRNGRFVDHYAVRDDLGMMSQLGL